MSVSPCGQAGSHSGIALVTGASGFIGRRLVDALVLDGYRVRTLGRSSIDSIEAEHTQADIVDVNALSRALNGVDVVFHLAGVGSPSSPLSMVDEMYRVNVVGTHNVLEAAKVSGVRRVIIASSAAVYGAIDSASIPENSPLHPTSPYGLSKLAQEHVSGLYRRVHGLECVALRLFNVYGPGEYLAGDNLKLIPSVCRQLMIGAPIKLYGDGSQSRDFVHIDDVVQSFIHMTGADLHGIGEINIGTGIGTSIKSVVDEISRVIGRRPEFDSLESRQGEVNESIADISLSRQLGFIPRVSFKAGIYSVVQE